MAVERRVLEALHRGMQEAATEGDKGQLNLAKAIGQTIADFNSHPLSPSTESQPERVFKDGSLTYYPLRSYAEDNGRVIPFSPHENKMFQVLTTRCKRFISSTEIYAILYPEAPTSTLQEGSLNIKNLVSRLSSKLDPEKPLQDRRIRYGKGINGPGYRYSPHTNKPHWDSLISPADKDEVALEDGNLQFYPERNTVKIDGKTILLTHTETVILTVLMQQRDTPISKDALLQQLSTTAMKTYNPNIIQVTIHRIRAKFKPHTFREKIVTRHGFGYEYSSE